MSRQKLQFYAALLGLTVLAGLLHASKQDKGLTKDDERLLESLLRDCLFDPRGAARVQVLVSKEHWEEMREGWLVPDRSGDRVFFADRESISAPAKEKITEVDFLGECRTLFGRKPDPAGIPLSSADFGRPPEYHVERSALVHAAWLYRLGEKDLAAQTMTHVPRDRVAAVASLRLRPAEASLNRVIQFYERRQEENALNEGIKLLRLYPVESVKLPQATPLVQDLKRRKQQGAFGKDASPDLPNDFANWDRKTQLAYLTDSLDGTQEDVRVLLQNGIGRLSARIDAFLKMGELAVPALLDVLEMDERMTRCVESPGRWSSLARVIPVREVAFVVLCKILRVRHLNPRDTKAEEFTAIPDDLKGASRTARDYWNEFGPLAYEARMMRVLCDPRSSFPALREAAKNISGDLKPGDSSWPSLVNDAVPNPAVLRFKNPTAAEAIVHAMDRDLAHDDSLTYENDNRAYHEPLYFWALYRVGDRRIAATLGVRAAKETNALMRVRWAHASHRLGLSQPIRDFAKQFAEGKIALAVEHGSPSRWQLENIIEHLVAAKLPDTDGALFKLAEPGHRYFDATKNGIVEHLVVYGSTGNFLDHPYCFGILRKLLDDTTATPVSLAIREPATGIDYTGGGSTGWKKMPAILSDPGKRKTAANIRRCDLAGEWCRLFAGLPQYHPLLKDAEERLVALKKAMDGVSGKYRILTPAERRAVAGNTYTVWFGPNIIPLGRPATVEDVRAGKAVFHLEGKGKLAKMELPALGTWESPYAYLEKPRHCLIVQAEIRPDREVLCGVIEQDRIRAVPAREFADISNIQKIQLEDDD